MIRRRYRLKRVIYYANHKDILVLVQAKHTYVRSMCVSQNISQVYGEIRACVFTSIISCKL